VLTSGEVSRLLRAARGEKFEALYVLAVTTGTIDRTEAVFGASGPDKDQEWGWKDVEPR